jgi:hypothetical protein
MALPFILRQKKNYGNSNISPRKNIIFKKILYKKNQNPLRYHTSITTHSQVSTQAKIYYLSKNAHIIKIDLLFIIT